MFVGGGVGDPWGLIRYYLVNIHLGLEWHDVVGSFIGSEITPTLAVTYIITWQYCKCSVCFFPFKYIGSTAMIS